MSGQLPPSARLPLASATQVRVALGRFVRERRRLALATIVLAASAALAGLVAPWAVGLMVDTVRGGGDAARIVTLTAWVAGAGALSAVLTAISSALVARIGQHVLAQMRETVLGSALRLPTGRLEESGRGDLLARVGDDVGVVSQAVVNLLAPWVGALLTIALTLVGLLALNPWLAAAGLTAIPVYVLALRWYLPRAAPRYSAERAAFGDRAEALVSSLSGLPTVHAYRAQDAHAATIAASSDRARTISRDVLWFTTGWGKWMNIAEVVGLGAIISVGFALVTADAASVGAVTAATLFFHRLFNPVGLIIFSFAEMQSAFASLQRMIGVVQAAPDPGAVPALDAQADPTAQSAAATARSGATPTLGSARLSGRGISHSYDDHEVVHDLSLDIPPGEKVALVGASGAGKSTLAVILAGLLEPTRGDVSIDGAPIAQLATVHPRPVVLVSQESHIFAGPLADDLRLARADATDDDLCQALALVAAADWVAALPDGLDTVVGELGHALTPEQSAQITLARAALADPAVLLLDEATAESSSRGATLLEDAAAAVLEGRTGLTVAHRLRQAQFADRVLVMADGRITEEGSHADLLAAGGIYAQLWTAYSARS